MNSEKVKSKNIKLTILGLLILLGFFKISVIAGFAITIGLCFGSLGEKLGWWDNN
jgi:hypothetical protein